MRHNIFYIAIVALLTLGTSSCSEDAPDSLLQESVGIKKAMTFVFSHPSMTRATESAFENGDKVGIYVTESEKPLAIGGNVINNQVLTFNGTAWESSKKLYWDDGIFNAFAYYPFQSEVGSVSDLMFEVQTDQSTGKTSKNLSGYEASDLLFAAVRGIRASDNPVAMTFKHIMSKLTIRLIKGEDYEGDLPAKAKVLVHNTVSTATIDLSAGVATKYSKGSRKSIIARQTAATTYSAIVVPQRIDNRMPLIEVIVDGVSFMYDSKFIFKPGMQHLVNLVLDKNPEQVKIEIGGELSSWQ